MKTARYTRYKRYEREGDLMTFLIEHRPKLPRGSAGRPEKKKTLWVRKPHASTLARVAWFGDEADPELAQALFMAGNHPKPAVRKEARLVVLDTIGRAMEARDRGIYERLAVASQAVAKGPDKPVIVALLVAWRVLTGKDGAIYCKTPKDRDKLPKPAELVREAERFFSGNEYERKSVQVSLFRFSKMIQGMMTYENEADYSRQDIGMVIRPI